MAKHVVAAVGDIPPGTRRLAQVNGRAIVVFNLAASSSRSTTAARTAAAVCFMAGRPASSNRTARANIAIRALARSSAVPGTAGSSTSAPASPGAIPPASARALCGLGAAGDAAGGRALCGRDRAGQRRGRLCGGGGVGVGEGIAGPAIALAAPRSGSVGAILLTLYANLRLCIITVADSGLRRPLTASPARRGRLPNDWARGAKPGEVHCYFPLLLTIRVVSMTSGLPETWAAARHRRRHPQCRAEFAASP